MNSFFPNLKRILALFLAFTLCTETLAESGLTAGGKNVLINDGEQVLEGAKVQGDSGVVLKGSKTSVLAARLRNMQSDYEYHEDTFTNSTDADGHDNTTHEHSKIISNGEITIDSDSIEADYTRKLKKDSGGFFTSFSDTGLSGANKPAWAKQVEASGKTIKWNPLEDSSKSWSVHQEVLNQEFTALVSLAAAVGTMWAGGFGVFATGGATAGGAAGTTAVVTNASMMSTIGTSMGQSALVGLASKGSVSLINNGFDLGKVASDLTSKESLKGLGLNMATAGLTAGIGHGLGLESIAPGMDMIDRTKILAQQGLISSAVRTGLAGATGENVGQTWKDEALSMGLALGQSKIGDIAQDNGLKTGSIGKVALHAGAGTAYSLATGSTALSGAIGGSLSELVAGVMESGSGLNGPPSDVPLTKEQAKINADKRINLNNNIKATTKLVSATATMLAGGNAKDITLSANVGESAVKHNRRLHPSEEQILAELQKDKTPEEQRRLELAAKYLVRASAGVPKKDKQHSPLSQDEIEGSKYIEEQKMLSSLAKERNKSLQWAQTMEVAKMAEGLSGDPDKYTQRTFDYTAGDAFGDLVSSKGEEAVFRFEHGEEAFVGTIGSLTLKGASKIINTMPFGLGNETATTLDNASYHLLEHAVTHGFGLIEPEYRPTEGSIVQASFKGPVKDSYTSEHASSLLSMGTIGLGSTIKGATKLGKIVPKGFKSTTVTKEPTINSLTTSLDSGQLYESGTSTRIGISEIDRAIKKAERREALGGKGSGEVIKQQNVHIISKSSPNPQYRVPGRVQSRIDLHKPGWEHTMHRHYNSTKNASQYTIPKTELREILQSKEVVHSPVVKILNTEEKLKDWAYVREVDVGKIIGVDKFTGEPTSKITILTDFKGKLRSASPGRLD